MKRTQWMCWIFGKHVCAMLELETSKIFDIYRIWSLSIRKLLASRRPISLNTHIINGWSTSRKRAHQTNAVIFIKLLKLDRAGMYNKIKMICTTFVLKSLMMYSFGKCFIVWVFYWRIQIVAISCISIVCYSCSKLV